MRVVLAAPATILALIAGLLAAPPATAHVTSTVVTTRTDFDALTPQSFSMPAGLRVVTVTTRLSPQDPLAQDLRCVLQAIDDAGVTTVLDQTDVRVQAQFAPLPLESNAFPQFALIGLVQGPVVLRTACTRLTGSGTAPRVTRLQVRAELDSSARRMVRNLTTIGDLPRLTSSGQVRALASLSLTPLDTRSGDLNCSLMLRSGSVATTLDSTVVRVKATPPPQTGPSNSLPRITLVGVGNAGSNGEAFVTCTPVATSGYQQPSVPRASLIVSSVGSTAQRTATDVLVSDGDRYLLTDSAGGPRSVTATLTLAPLSRTAGDLTCQLGTDIRRSGGFRVLDEARVRVRAATSPDYLTGNAFPRITLTGAVDVSGSNLFVAVRCAPVDITGYAQPRVTRVTLVSQPGGTL